MNEHRASSVKLLDGATATGAGAAHVARASRRTFQVVSSTSSGAGAAEVIVEVSNDGTNYVTMATFTLTLSTTPVTDGYASDALWRYTRGRVSSISGTGASVTLWMGA